MKRVLADTKAYVVLLLSALVAVIWVLVLGSMPVSSDKSPVRVLITQGASAREVASILHEHGLIRSQFVFRLTCRVGGSSGRLKPGVYEMNRAMGVPEIVKRLVEGQTLEQWVTIPEGYTARQIGDLLESKQLAGSDAFVRLAIEQGYEFPRYTFTHGSNLEGYLFPDTYLVSRGTNPRVIVDKMLQTFERKVVSACRSRIESAIRNRPELKGSSFAEGLHKILVLASMVEREARIPRDRPLIAAVLWNRLGRHMRLEVDATVSYRPGESKENKDRILYSDLAASSPYNTYRNGGLPPTPICNPGVAAVEAVLSPAQVDYLFYVAKPDGSHVFSRTFEEHVKAKNAIRNGGQ
jgi:UPF0755 protein